MHSKHIDWLRLNWAIVKLPTLFSEIFDIPLKALSSKDNSCQQSLTSSPQHISDVATKDEGEEDQEARSNEYLKNDYFNDVAQVAENTRNVIKKEVDQSDDQVVNGLDEDPFFSLASFDDGNDDIDAADLNPTVNCLDELVHIPVDNEDSERNSSDHKAILAS